MSLFRDATQTIGVHVAASIADWIPNALSQKRSYARGEPTLSSRSCRADAEMPIEIRR
jgi:hypothetical protein